MDYTNKISSLEEMSRLQVAINLCQENSFKEVALLLEKPTYGILLMRVALHGELYRAGNSYIFISDPRKLSIYANIASCRWSVDVFAKSCRCSDSEKAKLWDTAIEERCQSLMERIPGRLRQGVLMWMNRIALQFLSYSRRVEELFGVSRYFLMDVLTWDVWTKAGRLDEEKLALRLLQYKELTVQQRYRIACAYCLHEYVHRLWSRLTQGEKEMIRWAPEGDLRKETNDLVLWWSRRMPRGQEKRVREQTNGSWIYAASKATFYGNRAAVMQCWERLTGNVKQEAILEMALLAAERWEWARKRPSRGSYKEILVSNASPEEPYSIEHFSLPFYYSELVCFFLPQLNEENQLTFFKKAFKSCFTYRIVESFLDWPHRDFFLPTMNRLWGVIPPGTYGQCLLTLVSKYIGEDEYRENLFFDYGGLLGMLWEATPEEYKQYVFSEDNSRDYLRELLSGLLKKSPIQDEDEPLFKLLFRDLPEDRISKMMYSEVGERFCLQLVREERWSLGNRLLEACLPKEEIPGFRRWFLYSGSGFHFCVEEFLQNPQRLLNDAIDWCVDSEEDKEQFRCELISKLEHSNSLHILLFRGEFDKVDRMVDFLTSSEQKKKLYRLHFACCACRNLVGKSEEYRIDLILDWCLGDEKERRNDLKKHILECGRTCSFYSCIYSKPARDS